MHNIFTRFTAVLLSALLFCGIAADTVFAAESETTIQPESSLSGSESAVTLEAEPIPEPAEEPETKIPAEPESSVILETEIAPEPVYAESAEPEVPEYEFGGEYAMVLPSAEDVLQAYSDTHPALDLTAEAGAAVLAADDGTVVLTQTFDAPVTANSAAYGNMIQIRHADGRCTLYAHLDTIRVSVGDTVARGQTIGTVGSTGETDQPMLHLEVIEPLYNTDPYPLITGRSLYSQASLSSIQNALKNGSKYISDFGSVTREKVVAELQAHENDTYYLGTPYHGGDYQSPNGDTAYNGAASMNCAGFISYVLRKCGLDAEGVIDIIKETRHADWGSGRPYSILAGASNYYTWAANAGLTCYAYETFDELLQDGNAVKGDLVLYYVNQGWLMSGSEDNHLVFFWGDTPDDDRVWHQANIGITDDNGYKTNQIIPHYYHIDSAKYILIKMDASGYNTPAAPVVTAAANADTGKIHLSWTAVDGAEQYEIYRATSRNGKYYKMSPTKKTTYDSISITPGQTYYYKVRAVAADGSYSSYSNIASCQCRLPRPAVTATNVTATGKIMLTWNAVDGAAYYEIFRATSSTGTYSKMSPTTGTSYSSISITPGKKYYYRVRAVAADGTTSAYDTVARTCKLAQPAVTFSNTAAGKIRLSWDAVDGATGYEILRSASPNGTYSKMSPTVKPQYNNISVDPGDTYYYKVRAVCGNDSAASAYSKIVSGTCVLETPTVTISLNADGKPRLDWKAVDGAVQYEIYRAASKNGTYSKMSPTKRTYYQNPSAASGKTYYYKVRAISADSTLHSAFCNPVSIQSK